MNLHIKGTDLYGHVAPLRATEKQYETIDCNSTSLSIVKEGDRKYLLAATQQPQYEIFLRLNLSGDPSADDPLKKGIDQAATECSADEHFVINNSELMKLIGIVGGKKADFTCTAGSMTVTTENGQVINIHARHRTVGINIPPLSAINDHAGKVGYYHTVMPATDLKAALRIPTAVAKFGAKTCSLRDRVLHLTFSPDSYAIEAFSSTASVKFIDSKHSAVPAGDTACHLAITPQCAQVLMQICTATQGNAQLLYNSRDRLLTVWCTPYVITIDTEDIEHCDTPLHVPVATRIALPSKRFTEAVSAAKKTSSTSVLLDFEPGGRVAVSTPDGTYSDTLDGQLTGSENRIRISLPVQALYACISGCQSGELSLQYDSPERLVIVSREGLTSEIMAL